MSPTKREGTRSTSRAFQSEAEKWEISTGGGTLPRWSSGGRELFYIAADGNLMSVPLSPGRHAFAWSAPQRVFSMWILGTSYDVASGGERFLVLLPTDDVKVNELTVLLNWRLALHH